MLEECFWKAGLVNGCTQERSDSQAFDSGPSPYRSMQQISPHGAEDLAPQR